MKTALLLSLVTASLMNFANAKSLIGTVDSYIIIKTGVTVSIGTNDIEDDRSTATFYSYAHGKKITVNMSDLSRSTRSEIADVKAGESILITTQSGANPALRVIRECIVFNLYENKQAYVGCKTYEADRIVGYQLPQSLNYIIQNVENGVVAEVASLENFSKGDFAELRVETKNIKANKRIKILALYSNGEALIESSLTGLNFLNTNSILFRYGTERVSIQDLSK